MNSEERRRQLAQAILEEKLRPSVPQEKLLTPIEEQTFIIGQLMSKLLVLGFDKKAIGTLRKAKFDVNRLPDEFMSAHANLLAQRQVDETLYNLYSAVKLTNRINKGALAIGVAEDVTDMDIQDKKRAALVKFFTDSFEKEPTLSFEKHLRNWRDRDKDSDPMPQR